LPGGFFSALICDLDLIDLASWTCRFGGLFYCFCTGANYNRIRPLFCAGKSQSGNGERVNLLTGKQRAFSLRLYSEFTYNTKLRAKLFWKSGPPSLFRVASAHLAGIFICMPCMAEIVYAGLTAVAIMIGVALALTAIASAWSAAESSPSNLDDKLVSKKQVEAPESTNSKLAT
jgi:hypothetical protein